VQLPVLALQHTPPAHVSPPAHLFIGWHMHPSDPGVHSVGSTEPVEPGGITHLPEELQTPLAQSAPVMQVVLGNPGGMQYPPVQLPLWQSLATVQCEPAGEPELVPPEPLAPAEPPLDVEPPALVELRMPVELLPDVEPPAPVGPLPDGEPPVSKIGP
jgi:hypothetical protein